MKAGPCDSVYTELETATRKLNRLWKSEILILEEGKWAHF